MEREPLDLRSQYCPMAFLLAKRYCAQLAIHETATILSSDHISIKDMVRYFSQSPFSVKVLTQSSYKAVLVTRKE